MLQSYQRLLEVGGVAPWLRTVIGNAIDGLTLVALGILAITSLVAMLRGGWKAVKKQ